MRHFLFSFFTVIVLLFSLTSCSSFRSTSATSDASADIAKCTYEASDITNFTVSKINFTNLDKEQINVHNIAKLTKAVATRKVPISMDVLISVHNPTATKARMKSMEWVFGFDGLELASGTTKVNTVIRANSTTIVPINIATDVFGKFSVNDVNKLISFVQATLNGGNGKLQFKVKPTYKVGRMILPPTDYLVVSNNIKII